MLRLLGREIPDTAEELLRSRCALVVWDMQQGIAPRASNFGSLVASTQDVLVAARRRSLPVIYSQHYSLPLALENPAQLRAGWRAAGRPEPEAMAPPAYLRGTGGWQFVHDTAPEPGDLVIPKTRPDFFVDTPLKSLLAGLDVHTIVMTGVAADRGVLATVRSAVNHGLMPVVVADAVGSFSDEAQRRALEQLRELADVYPSGVVIDCWQERR